ncbi:zinc finger protein OBI1-like [Malaya genurostris]|uniref:zinc finger protein OBI1-like n=1 Tax=Malaya genurostris TaxID=325434 RepID=UPI0026F383E0|nr:zinc finger protein OBI1-like [Malaya genurostris]
MSSIGDNSPLWGSTQYIYPKSSAPWPSSPDHSPQCSYSPYLSREGSEYTELKPDISIEIVEADSTIGENATAYHEVYQQQPLHGGMLPGYMPPTFMTQSSFPNGNNYLLPPENGSFMFHNRQLSPDGGYSSPSSIGSEYYAAYHAQSQAYTASLQPYYHNVVPPSEPVAIKYEILEVPVKEESLGSSYKPEEPSYLQHLETFDAQKVHSKKAIIHENIIIRPASKSIDHESDSVQAVDKVEHSIYPYEQVTEPIQFHIQPASPLQIEQQVPQSVDQPKQHQRNPRKRPRETSNAEKSSIIPTTVAAVPRTPVPIDASKRRSARPSMVRASPYSCEDCGNYFARQCGLTQHRKWIHSENRLIPCEKCGKKFLSEDELAKHMLRHEQEDKPYKCSRCTKQFCHKNDLRRHMYRHDNTAPFSCNECQKSFIRKDHLVAHLLAHERREKRAQSRSVVY